MGGSLALTIRLQDGTEHRMNRWTNTMPVLLTNPAFLDGTPEGIAEALADWEDMRADWNANAATGTFAHPMTPAYGPYPYGLRPSEYGAVVVDFVSKTLLSLQGYSHFDRAMALRQTSGLDAQSIAPSRAERLNTLIAAGRITSWVFFVHEEADAQALAALGGTCANRQGVWEVTIPGTVDINTLNACCDGLRVAPGPHPQQDLLDAAQKDLDEGRVPEEQRGQMQALITASRAMHRRDPFLFGHAMLDLAPFTLEEFPETAQGYTAMRARLLDLGFTLSPEDMDTWDARIAACVRDAQDS